MLLNITFQVWKSDFLPSANKTRALVSNSRASAGCSLVPTDVQRHTHARVSLSWTDTHTQQQRQPAARQNGRDATRGAALTLFPSPVRGTMHPRAADIFGFGVGLRWGDTSQRVEDEKSARHPSIKPENALLHIRYDVGLTAPAAGITICASRIHKRAHRLENLTFTIKTLPSSSSGLTPHLPPNLLVAPVSFELGVKWRYVWQTTFIFTGS